MTAFAESAGSISLTLHMCSNLPLFKRAILQSGNVASNTPPADLQEKEEDYLRLLDYCGIDKDDQNRLEKLRQVPAEKLVAAVADFQIPYWSPVAEKDFFPVAPNYNNFTKLIADCNWVNELIIGDCCFEVVIAPAPCLYLLYF